MLSESVTEKFKDTVRDAYRKGMKMSQEELAYQIGRDPRSIVAIENGNRNPTLQTVYKICKVLKVKSSNLLPF